MRRRSYLLSAGAVTMTSIAGCSSTGEQDGDDAAAEFEVTSVEWATERIAVGETAEVSIAVENVGDAAGEFSRELLVDGDAVDEKRATLDPGGTTEFTHELSPDDAGEHSIALGDVDLGTLVVREPRAEFEVSAAVDSEIVGPGESVRVDIDVANTGELEGTRSVAIASGDDTLATREVRVAPGEEERVRVALDATEIAEYPGTREISVDGEDAGELAVRPPELTGRWPARRYDARNTAANESGTGPTDGAETLWSRNLTYPSAPVVADGRVHVCAESRLLGFDGVTGEEVLSVEIDSDGLYAPAVGGGLVFAVSREGSRVFAVDPQTGERRWERTFDYEEPDSSPVFHDGAVYGRMTTSGRSQVGNRVYKLDARTGDLEWKLSGGCGFGDSPWCGAIIGGPAVAGDDVFLATSIDGLVSIDASAGEVNWTGGAEASTRPVVYDDVVYYGWSEDYEDNGALYAYDASRSARGEYLGRSAYDEWSPFGIAVTSERIILRGSDDVVRGISDGGNWRYDLDGGYHTDPVVVGDTVYVSDASTTLHAVDAESGDPRWTWSGPESNYGPWGLAVVDRMAFVPTDTGLHAVHGKLSG